MRKRVQCLIIKDKKMLLVRDNSANHFYPPGGAVEQNESYEQAIKRELREELSVSVTKSTFYFSYDHTNVIRGGDQRELNYFVEYEGTIKPTNEIEECLWLSFEQLQEKDIMLPDDLFKMVLQKLRDEKLF